MRTSCLVRIVVSGVVAQSAGVAAQTTVVTAQSTVVAAQAVAVAQTAAVAQAAVAVAQTGSAVAALLQPLGIGGDRRLLGHGQRSQRTQHNLRESFD